MEKLIKDTIIYFLSKFLPSIVSFFILALYLSKMDPREYGIFSIFILSIGLVGILSSQWIRSSMIRYYYEFNNIIAYAIIFQAIMVGILTIISIIIGIIISVNVMLMALIIITLVSLLTNELFNNYFRIVIKPKKVLIGNVIKNIFYISFLLLIILGQDENISFSQALTGYLIGLLISNLYYLLVSNKNFKRFSIDIKILKYFARYGVPLTISFALGVLLQNIDKYMITYQLGAQSNGNYSLVFDFVHNYLYMIMGSLGLASLPRMLKNSKVKNQVENFQKYVKNFHLMCMPILFIFIMFTPEISTLINSHNYETSPYILIFIGIATYVHGINSYIYGQGYQLMESTKHILLPSIVAVIVNVIINFIFLEKYGVIISAISSLVAFSISNLLLYINLNKVMSTKMLHKSTINLLILFSAISCTIFIIPNYSIVITAILKVFILSSCIIIVVLVKKTKVKFPMR